MKTPLRDHLLFWILPSLVVLAAILMFFSGVPLLRSIVAPEMGREYGFLENLQVAVLLFTLFLAARGLRVSVCLTERMGFGFLLLAFAFLLMEEINYGANYWKLLTGQSLAPVGRGNEINLHNRISTSPIKSTANLILLVGFVILPLLVRDRAPAWLRYLTPPRLLIVTILCSVLLSKFAHFLDDNSGEEWHPLGSNIAEFREVFIYYIGLIYVYTLVVRRRWPGWRGEHGDPPRSEG